MTSFAQDTTTRPAGWLHPTLQLMAVSPEEYQRLSAEWQRESRHKNQLWQDARKRFSRITGPRLASKRADEYLELLIRARRVKSYDEMMKDHEQQCIDWLELT